MRHSSEKLFHVILEVTLGSLIWKNNEWYFSKRCLWAEKANAFRATFSPNPITLLYYYIVSYKYYSLKILIFNMNTI